jgi:aspartyl-tRNA(Asn)/glutamyl-tRNA(Gln) amidotransferase subunit A
MSELFKLGVKEASDLIAKGEITSTELTQSIIDRVHAEDGRIGAYLTFDEEGALSAAKEADAAIKAGTLSGPLAGIPIAIKDLINVKGQPCTCASKILKGYVSPYDATVIANLKKAGAV